jgi:selenocysteine lyase/cysteine desulfurase
VGVSISAPAEAKPAPADLAAIRALFKPAPGTIYLDTATYGLPPQPTVDALQDAIAAWQAGSASWRADWDEPADECRALFATLVGANESEIARIPAAAVGMGLVAASLRPGDEVVVPDDEFTSTLFPILVAERRGALVRQVPFPELAGSIRPGTKMVATSLVQMQTGRVVDLEDLVARAQEVGARIALDATQGVPFVPLHKWIGHVDYAVCAGYKHLLCPRGVAFLYVREDRWDTLEPLNANWRSADRPFERYFGGPLTLAPGAHQFETSLAWFPWFGAIQSLRLLASWKESGLFPGVLALARDLAERIGVPFAGSSLVSAPIADVDGAREALRAVGVKAALRGTGIRFACHVYTTPDDVRVAADAIRPFVIDVP